MKILPELGEQTIKNDSMEMDRSETIRRLFAEAMERPPEERKAWLADICGEDSALREEVGSLLATSAVDAHHIERLLKQLPKFNKENEEAPAVDPSRDQFIGENVLHYEILERVGRGGMGLVYKARDKRLNRVVALKFLPPELIANPDAKRRLIHEAQSASVLDHPNICTVYEINESAEGQLFIAMAYVDGVSLQEKLGHRPLPLEQAIEIGIQVAEGLACAHERGILHRDIKPANVMVNDRGQVKIVDFGLAKVPEVSLTQTGVTLGTVAYMSPEQVRNESFDRRTDIWALGLLLYEMVTGQRPFKGNHGATVAHAILYEDPEPITALRSGVPLALERIVAKAIEKEPGARYQHVDEIPVDLRALQTSSGGIASAHTRPTPARGTAPRRAWIRRAAFLGALLAAFIVGAIALWRLPSPAPESRSNPVRFAFQLDSDQQFRSWFQPMGISPDGSMLVYAAQDEGPSRLYLRNFNQLEAEPIDGTDHADGPFFSADGQWIGFFSEGMLKKVPVLGGIPQVVCDASGQSLGASWSRDDVIVFSNGVTSGLLAVSAEGGKVERLTIPDQSAGEIGHAWPQHLPDGKTVLFTIWGQSKWRAAVLNEGTKRWNTILENGAGAHYLPTGHVIYAQMTGALAVSSLLAMPFDASTGRPTGPAVSVLAYPGLDAPNFAASNTGTLVYVAHGSAWPAPEENAVVWVDSEGSVSRLLERPGRYETPRLSPGGQRLLVSDFSKDGTYDIWLYELERHTSTRLTSEGNINNFPLWTPDGRGVAFNSTRKSPGIYLVPADGSENPSLLLARGQYPQIPGSWSPDGDVLAFTEVHGETSGDIWILPVGSNPEPFLRTEFNEAAPVFSPDGRHLAYTSDKTGRDEVYLRTYPESGKELQVSEDGGREPAWSRDGKLLFYRRDGAVVTVPVKRDDEIAIEQARLLFHGEFERVGFSQRNFSVSDDGRFVMIRRTGRQAPTELHVVLNWFEELRRKVPSR